MSRDRQVPDVSVVVPAHNAEATVARTLAALERQDVDREFEVIVVDDDSSDETAARVAAAGGRARLVRQRPGAGASAARNRGAAEAAGEVLAFTDSDCLPTSEWLRHALRCLEDADLVVGSVRPERGVAMGPFDRSLVVERFTGLFESANVVVRRRLFERVGGFQPWIDDRGRPLSEDVWLGWRARRAGARTAFCPDAVVEHAVLPGGARWYVEERLRRRHFPTMVARVPELRDELMYRRWFLTPHTAAFDLAVAALLVARATRSGAPLVAAGPYGRHVVRRARWFGRGAPAVALVELVADAVGLAALLYGSARRRAIVL